MGPTSGMFKRIARAYRRHGLMKLCWLVPYNALYFAKRLVRREVHSDDEFDRTYGTDTSEIREIGSLEIGSENARYAVRYQPTDPAIFLDILGRLDADLSSYSFVDFGCGKGKMLLLASEFPFKRIVGIEFSAELALIAGRNIDAYRTPHQRCRHIMVECCDAVTYEPPTDPVVCYFYNPFDRPVLQKVIANLEESLNRVPRQALIVYVDPRHADLLQASRSWEPVVLSEPCKVYRYRQE
jgi:SAM-dependent methyltransferase